MDWEDRDTDSVVGADLLRREPGGIVELAPVPADSSSPYSPDRGDLDFLLVGNTEGRTATTQITFAGLPDSLQLDDARLVLSLQAYDWEGPSEEVLIEATGWAHTDGLPVIALADTMSVGHEVTQTLPLIWVDGQEELSLQLLPGESAGSCAFASSELGDGPSLALEYTEDDSVRVLHFEATEDTYFLDGGTQVGGLVISQAEPARVRAYFHPKALRVSADTTLVSATLKLENLSIGQGSGLTLVAYPGDGSSEEVGRAAVSASDSAFSIVLSEDWVLEARSWVGLPPDSSCYVMVGTEGEARAMGWLQVGRPALTAVYSVAPRLD